MANAYIGYDNKLDTGTVVASSEPAATPKENCYDWNLFVYWQPTAGTSHTLDIDMASAVAVDYFAFYSSDLYLQTGATVKLYSGSSSPATTLVGTITPTTRGPKFLAVTTSSLRYWRLTFATTASYAPKIQLAALGARLEIEKGLRDGFAPPALGARNASTTSTSQGGLFIGRSVAVAPVKFNMSMTNLTASWIRTNWPALLAHIEAKPFYLLPEPDGYTDEAVIAWTVNRPAQPVYSDYTLMRINLALEAFI